MSDTTDILEVDQHYRFPGVADYSRQDAEMMVGQMVKSATEAGVYGKITDVQGYVDRRGDQKPYYGVVVDWAAKPKAEISKESILFRRELDKHYPLVYGPERDQAEHVYAVAKESERMKSEMASAGKSKGRGR